jgi:S1-C subfamily serine protease
VDELGSAYGQVGAGFIVHKVNGRDVTSVADVERVANTLRAGQVVSLVVRPPGQQSDVIVNYRVR